MAKMYINPKTLSFALFNEIDVDAIECFGGVDAATYVENLQNVIREIIEDAKDGAEIHPALRIGFSNVTWISLNKAERLVKGELK